MPPEVKLLISTQKRMTSIPHHIAIIMDGNGRWAQKRHMPRTVGHAKGAAGVRELVEFEG
jgi:undecaprenyl diphosphate synthase